MQLRDLFRVQGFELSQGVMLAWQVGGGDLKFVRPLVEARYSGVFVGGN